MARRLEKTSQPDIRSSIHNFPSAAASNAGLGRIFALLAAGRSKRQDALSLSYRRQLMLHSRKGFNRQTCLSTCEKIFERDLLRVLNASARRAKSWFIRRREESEGPAEQPQQAADETNSALANQT